jgi:phosphatidyl-myo-inositol dimannoside synthase
MPHMLVVVRPMLPALWSGRRGCLFDRGAGPQERDSLAWPPPNTARMILFTTQNFLPDVGGIQIYMTGLADTLAARGHAVAVYCDADDARLSDAVDRARPYPIVRFGGPRPWQRWRKARAVARRIAQGDVQAVVADSWKSLALLPARTLQSAHVLCLAHGWEFRVPPDSLKQRRLVAALAKADIVGANSHFTRDVVQPFLKPGKELRVLLPGVYPPAGAVRNPAPSRVRGLKLVTIARLDPFKGVDTVLHAVSRLKQKYPGLTYHVIGDGADRKRLPALARELGIGDAVHFHGEIGALDSRKAALLADCDIFVSPNRDVESFGIVFVEAGALGLPCIAGKEGGTADAVLEGETGLRVDGADVAAVTAAIAKLLDDPDRAAAMGQAGQDRFWSEFAWDAAIGRFESALGL